MNQEKSTQHISYRVKDIFYSVHRTPAIPLSDSTGNHYLHLKRNLVFQIRTFAVLFSGIYFLKSRVISYCKNDTVMLFF